MILTVSDGSKSHSKWGGFIPKIDFDPVEFGIPPQSLAAIDPTQLLSLLVARQALENAGYGEDVNRENVSVIIGAEGGNDLANNYGFRSLYTQFFGEIPKELDDALPKLTEDSFPGVLANVISGRITNRLNLGGRNYTVDAACASSLAAIDLACQELVLGRSEMVLAGGADLHNGINDYLMFSSTHALSRKGRCATFDSEADGIALGEGVAMVVLKRHEDALRDGDTIYAVIKGVGRFERRQEPGPYRATEIGTGKSTGTCLRSGGYLPGRTWPRGSAWYRHGSRR
jgi:acyl transferase domain-containing protein